MRTQPGDLAHPIENTEAGEAGEDHQPGPATLLTHIHNIVLTSALLSSLPLLLLLYFILLFLDIWQGTVSDPKPKTLPPGCLEFIT